MKDSKISNQKEKKKIKLKYKKNIFLDISIDKQNKMNKKEKLKKSIKKENKTNKEENNEILENKYYNEGEKNEQLKNCYINNNFKNEKFMVNKFIKMQKISEKKSGSEINKEQLKKKRSI